ncbi:C40 family peptidase [Fannyhessea vaginae]|uniref:C40 family peptidase n=1 Tax=Fannyhessea vaginae TaxID=82135 RepID=UPI00336AB164
MKATKPRGKVKKPSRSRGKVKKSTRARAKAQTGLKERSKKYKRANRTKEATTKHLAAGKATHKAQRLKYVLHKVGASAALAGKAARVGARAGAGAVNKAARLKAFVDKNSAYNESDENDSQNNLEKSRRAKERARKFRRWRKNRKRRREARQLSQDTTRTAREKAQKRVRKRLSSRQKLRQRLAQRAKRALKQIRKRLEALIRRALTHALLHLAPLAAGIGLMLLLVVGLPCCICMVAFPAMQSQARAGLANSQREIVVNAALSLQGLPYVWGGESITDGMDCSGLTQYAYGKINVSLPHLAQGQYDLVKSLGNLVTDVDQLQRGDLVFFGTPDNIYHVAIYMGNHKIVHEAGDYCKISDINDCSSFAGGGCPVAGGLQGGATGGVINVPQSDYNSYTITEYDQIDWAQGSRQRELYDMWYSQGHWTNGIATIDGCYLIACTPTFGQVGDYVTFYLSDGTAIPCIIADEKNTSDEGCNSYGHDNGHSVIEFEVKSSYYHSYGNPGHGSWFPEWGGDRLVASCVNSGKNILG